MHSIVPKYLNSFTFSIFNNLIPFYCWHIHPIRCIKVNQLYVQACEPRIPGSIPQYPLATFHSLILLPTDQRLPKLLPYCPQMGLTIFICIWGCSSNSLSRSQHIQERTFRSLVLPPTDQRLLKLLPYCPQMRLTMFICIWGCSSNSLSRSQHIQERT